MLSEKWHSENYTVGLLGELEQPSQNPGHRCMGVVYIYKHITGFPPPGQTRFSLPLDPQCNCIVVAGGSAMGETDLEKCARCVFRVHVHAPIAHMYTTEPMYADSAY
jgi:hypothetical protein